MQNPKPLKKIYHWTIYVFAYWFAWFAGRLSYGSSQKLGSVLGRWACYILHTERKKARKHVTEAFKEQLSPEEVDRLVISCFEHLGKCVFELFQLPKMVASDISKYVHGTGLEYLEEARKQNKGVIMITGHIGNWELLGAYLARCNTEFTVIARENSNPYLNTLLMKYRRIAGFNTIMRGGMSTAKESLRILRSGGLLGMLIDQHTRVESVRAPFFGIPAYTPTGPFTLARKTNAPVIFTNIHRMPDGTHRASFSKPVDLRHSEDKAGDLEKNAGLINALYEDTIRQYPEQWVWMHRRWRE